MRLFVLYAIFIFSAFTISAQTVADYAVQLTAQGQVSPPKITLTWKAQPGAGSFSVYKKAKSSNTWGAPIATLPGTSTTYADNSVVVDSAYEYAVMKPDSPAYGYIYAAIKAPAIHNRGALLLLVDSTFTDPCNAEITQLTKDMSADGWEVLRKDFLRTTGVGNVKNYIVAQYQANANLKAVMILGHLAVPYSGNYNPDAHADHKGAWAADTYYGDMDGTWTDNSVNNTAASRPENRNIPSDGKWDQSQLPSGVELQVSRIDFANMPVFAKTEVQLMKGYLNKDHQYKIGALTVTKRVLVDDNFGKFSGEGFAAGALRLAPLVGTDSIRNLDYLSTLNTTPYQWAYGCGGGSYSSAGGIATSADFTTNNVNNIFTMLFGSYFGDWDSQDNFLRAVLCSNNPALTSCWSGRPHWFMHHMALGEPIGYSTITTQNNISTYNNKVNYTANGVHIALMGDLTLRTDYMAPPTNVILTGVTGKGAEVSWTASTDAGVIGYYVYRSDTVYGKYDKRSGLLTTTSYTDSFGTDGQKYYMVRAVKLQSTPSGSYYNLSLGNTSAPATIDYPFADNTGITSIAVAGEIAVYPNPATDRLNLQFTAVAAAKAQIAIVDIQGKKVMEQDHTVHAGDNLLSVQVGKLIPGIYQVVIKTDGHSYTRKWIKKDD